MSRISIGKKLYLKGRVGWKGLKKSEYLDSSEYRIINASALENEKINWNKAGYISKDRYEESPEIMLQKNDILISKDGTLGKIGYVEQLDSKTTVASGIFVLRNTKPEVINTRYLYQLLKSDIFKKFIKNNKAEGSTINHLYQADLVNFEVDFPSLFLQNSISNILDSIDSKISINNKINDNLYEQMKFLYDYYFLQFDFPNEGGKPYKSVGGQMVWNKILKRHIPANWMNKNIKEISSITWGQCPDGKNILDKTTQGQNLLDYCSGAGDMKGGFVVDCQAKTDNSKRLSHKNDILISIAGKIGDICVVDHTISLGRAAMAYTANSHIELPFIYLTLCTLNKKMTIISTGSIQKVINNAHIDDFNFAYSEEVVKQFGQATIHIFQKLMYIANENRELAKLRDFLLPLLMNGQATIKD
ncbi:restriction endonuclease subunit S [Ureaplasma diversum]|uniref:Type I restriction modification system specificity (S) subunit, HsdS n=2 Tax=Ureaplasma diversum TaxID=42094 RepID=A0A084F1M0_9BACT|nr:restriction endonuclease subunit S [Ureaplasma diversum]KEZ24112.1 Type I restriction modification system specificity (S) subunit, HsdS [Ureaplasma diversum NCTC 246]